MNYVTSYRYHDLKRQGCHIMLLARSHKTTEHNRDDFSEWIRPYYIVTTISEVSYLTSCRYHDLARQSISQNNWEDFWEWISGHEIVTTISAYTYFDIMSLSRSHKTIDLRKQLKWLLVMNMFTWNCDNDVRRRLFEYDIVITISQDNLNLTKEMRWLLGMSHSTWNRYYDDKIHLFEYDIVVTIS